jgi:alpha-N-arabinofuranosidase
MTLRFFSVLGFALLTSAGLRGEDDLAQITIDASVDEGPVNSHILGHSIEAGDAAGVFEGSGTVVSSLVSGSGFWDPKSRAPDPAVLERCRAVGMGMLRYPGGSLANNFDWRKAVGPLDQRGNWKFGVDEYITLCRAIGAEPLITVSDYVLPADEMPKHNADFVEYLNAPATPEYPWAQKRALWGHPKPYGVKWFELGNESNVGNTDVKPHRQYSPQQYVKYATDCTAAMKAVDPTIKVGIVTAADVEDILSTWDQVVVHDAGPIADFVVLHEYAPLMGPSMPLSMEPQLMQGAMAEGEQYEDVLQRLKAGIHRLAGKDLPIAVTEYNAFGSLKPKPYHLSYAAGLECADLIRIFLKPGNDVCAANYWQFLNGYWGMVATDLSGIPQGTILERPAYPLYRLWGQHFGQEQVKAEVSGPTQAFGGVTSVLPARGTARQLSVPAGFATIAPSVDAASLNGKGYSIQWTGKDSFVIKLDGLTGDAYPNMGTLVPVAGHALTDCDYLLDFDARYVPTGAGGTEIVNTGLELEDARGWDATGSISQIKEISAPTWKHFTGQPLITLLDAPGVHFNAILAAGAHTMSGQMEVRSLQVKATTKSTFPEYALVTSAASLNKEQTTLYVIIFNKSVDRDISTQIHTTGFPATAAKYWQVNGPEMAALSDVKETVSAQPVSVSKDGFSMTLPAHSMTAVELVR